MEFEANLGYRVTLSVKIKDEMETETVDSAGETAQVLRAHTALFTAPASIQRL